MGTIVERPRRDGSVAYMAQISIMRDRKIVHRESKTFDRPPAANAWIKKRENELSKPGAPENVKVKRRDPTLAEVIDRYTNESEKAIGRTKAQVLRSIKDFGIAGKPCSAITSVDVVEFARQKLETGVKPQTVSNYLSHLGSVFSIARPAWGYELEPQAMEDAWKVTKRMGTTRKSEERDRRPTFEELDALMNHFAAIRLRRPSNPMHVITAFAIFSTRRLEEITRIAWTDLDIEGKRVIVRDMKNPGEKIGNDVRCDLPDPCIRIIRAMPGRKDEIFPYNGDAISAAFTRACKLLKIDDLHFHDLRHDGVSRLFEMGCNIPQVAAVSGHRSWTSLKRYTHLRQTGDRYAGWSWLDEIAPTSEESRTERTRI